MSDLQVMIALAALCGLLAISFVVLAGLIHEHRQRIRLLEDMAHTHHADEQPATRYRRTDSTITDPWKGPRA